MELIDLPDSLLLGRVAAVVREVVVAVGHADRSIAAVAAVVGEDEGRDSRQVGLERQREQVGHQPEMLLVIGRDSERSRIFHSSQIERGPGSADPLLDLPDAVEILVQLATVGGAEHLMELSGVLRDEIEDALAPAIDLRGVDSDLGGRRAGRRPAGD